MRGKSVGRAARRAAALGVMAFVVLGVLGVGRLPSASAVGNQASSTKAYQATIASDSAVIVATYSLTYRGGKRSFSMTTMGPFSWSQDRGDFSVNVVGSGSTITTEEIVDGNETYSATSTTGLPAGDNSSAGWTETTWRGHGAGGGLNFFDLFFGYVPGSGTNPKAILALLRGKATRDERMGRAVLNGVDTSRFRSSIPFSSLGVTGASTAQIERALGSKALMVDYWTDSSDRLRLMRFSLKIAHPPKLKTTHPGSGLSAALVPITESVQLQLSDYGTYVNVTPPPPNEITSRTTCEVTTSGFSC